MRLTKKAQETEDVRRATLNLLADLEGERSALAVANAKLEALLESVGEGIIATNESGIIITVNQAAKELLKGTSKVFLGKSLFEVIQIFDEEGKAVPLAKRPFNVAFLTGKSAVANYDYLRHDGTKFPAAITVAPVIMEKKIVGAIEIFRDISLEKELAKAKDEFISLASHQLKGPITAISWSLGEFLIKYKNVLTEAQREMLDKVYSIDKGMMELVGGFLDVTRMETSGFAVESGKVDLRKACDLVLEELTSQIGEKKIEIIRDYDEKIPQSNIGLKAARIIFQNLITNAVKYSKDGGQIEINIEKMPSGTRLIVKDYGFGIPEEAKKKIFTKLFRADNAKEREPSGTGLGLYLVKALVDKTDGMIWFESLEGEGSTFFIDLKT